MKEMICIVCPRGCRLIIDEKTLAVSGNACRRGADYAVSELTSPMRTLTTTVSVEGNAGVRRLPVKTSRPISKAKLLEAARLLDTVIAEAPVKSGDVIVENILGTGADIIAGRDIDGDDRAK